MSLLGLVFGCSHKHCSFPITVRARTAVQRSAAASVTGTYVVCLDCGKEFPYDWQAMKIIRTKPQAKAAVAVVPDQKVA